MFRTKNEEETFKRKPKKLIQRTEIIQKKEVTEPLTKMKVAVIGLGYIGLSLSLVLAEKHKVIGIEKDKKKLNKLKNRQCYIKTNDIRNEQKISAQEYLNQYLDNSFFVTDSIKEGIKNADAVIVAVNCYPTEDNLHIDYKNLKEVTKEIAKNLKKNQRIGIMTTVPPLTIKNIIKPILEKYSGLKAGKDFYLAYSPEWISEQDDSLHQFRTIPRLIGGINKESTDKLAEIFEFLPQEIVKLSSPESAELAKLFENTYLFINLAYANECGKIAEKLGVDGFEAIMAANKLDKVHMFYPGVWGGSCLPKDYRLLTIATQEETGYVPNFIWAARDLFYGVNEDVVRKIRRRFKESDIIGILGLSFKPKTDDTRNSPALYIIKKLQDKGYKNFLVYDPMVNEKIEGTVRAKSIEEIQNKADCIVICTGWKEFKKLNLEKSKFIIDTVGLFKDKFMDNLIKIGSGK